MIPPVAVGSTIIAPHRTSFASDAEVEAEVEAYNRRRHQAMRDAIEIAQFGFWELYDEPSTCSCCGATAWLDKVTVDVAIDFFGYVVRYDSRFVDVAMSKKNSDAAELHYECIDCFAGRTIRRGRPSEGVSLWLESTSEWRRR